MAAGRELGVKKKKMGLLKKIGIAVLVLIVLAAIAGGGSKKDKETTNASGEKVEQTTKGKQEGKKEKEPAAESKKEGEKSEENAKEEPKPEPQEETQQDEGESLDESLVRPEFKEAMDSYEAFFDEYVEYMNAFKDDPTNAEVLAGYADMLRKEADMIKEFDDWEKEGDMTAAETAYYLEVHARIYEKLAQVG